MKCEGELINMTRGWDNKKNLRERKPGIRKVMGSIPVWDSLFHARVMFINSPSLFITELKIDHLY